MLPAYLQVPWMEEVLTILFTAVVYILAHFSLKSAKLLPHEKEVKRGKKTIKDPTEAKVSRHHGNTGLDYIKAGALVRSPQPKTWKEVEGVTDSRFQGTIVCYKPEEGYGFIRCPELYKHFSRDVFLHRLQVGSFNVGATVSFGVFLNKEGLPQAKELEAALPVREVPPQPEASRVPAPDFSKQRAELFMASGYRPQHTQGLCQTDQVPTMPPKVGLQAWADIRPRVLSLSGLWAGDRASTYEVHFHIDPPKGQPSVGTVVRCRPNCAPKSLHLLWDETSGQLSLSDHFALDIHSLSMKPDRAIWWRGQSQFVWQRLQQRCDWGNDRLSQELHDGGHSFQQHWGSPLPYPWDLTESKSQAPANVADSQWSPQGWATDLTSPMDEQANAAKRRGRVRWAKKDETK